jgi:serine phosphatase RsbU (regulator of sigma subunit)
MSVDPIESKAFQRAALKSESYRILGLLCVLGGLFLYAIARGVVTGELRLLLTQILLLAVAAGFEGGMLMIVRRAIRLERDIPQSVWLAMVFVETLLPTIAIFMLTESRYTTPYQALVAPVVLVYFFLIILTALRLSPSLSLLTGLLSALGYLAATLYTHRQYPNPDAGNGAFPLAIYIMYAVSMFIGGLIAAFVAGQIRTYVSAALREAELQRKLERMNHDLGIARSIQQGLLPRHSPELTDFEIAGWNQPADQTGGDYFDWQALPDGRLAISLGDVTGHGIGPALVTAACRAYARASFLAGGDPVTVMERLNHLLAEDLPPDRFVTYAVALLDPVGSRLQLLSAGHGPILWYRPATGEIRNLDAQGIPLGLIPDIEYGHATETPLAPGDMLVLVTDGFYEWENPQGEEFGLTRLQEVIRESCDYPACEVIQRLHSTLLNFCQGTEQKDDLTAVVLKRKVETANLDAGCSSR